MALYMKYGEIDGKVETEGYKKWIEINSFQWGVARNMSSAMASSEDREASHVSVSEITITKEMDVSSRMLLEDALGGKLSTDVTISVCTTGQGKLIEFLCYKLTNTGLSAYTVQSGGDRPTEQLTLNFTAVAITYTSLNSNLQGQPATTTYDLAKMKLNP